MPATRQITAEDAVGRLDWTTVIEALRQGHLGASPQMDDLFLTREKDTLLNRAAWIPGLGVGLKTVTIMNGNRQRGLPSVQGVLIVFDEQTGTPEAIIDSALVTHWKTAADSGLGASYLARPDSKSLVVLGAGKVAASLVEVYTTLFPELEEITIWSRTQASAEALVERLADQHLPGHVCTDLATAVGKADIVASATMTHDPILQGDWVGPGTHVDLIGAYRADMREADDNLMRKGRVFVDSRESTVDHIGEIRIPIAEGVITAGDICGDLYELATGKAGRHADEEITVYKNGGGAHLDLMTAKAIMAAL